MSRPQVQFDEKAIDALFRELDQSHLPGAAVGIAIGGVPVYRKGFGLSSMEQPLTITPHTRMRIYSITKHFTCLAYLLLCEDGKADIDDSLGKYLPELHPVTHRVTMRQLMSHTSGLRDACDIRYFFNGIGARVSAEELLELYREIPDVNFAPGHAWCYNNGGYQILGSVIERLTEKTLEEVFRERIFEPAGMYDTLLRRVDTDFVPNSATMHVRAPDGSYEKKNLPGENVGEGGIVSTADDMLRWVRNMTTRGVGCAETWTLLRTPYRLSSGGETGYGLGLMSGSYCGIQTVSHNGGGLGSNAQMIRVPAADLDIVVLVNRSDANATEIAGNILDACFGKEPEPRSMEHRCVNGVFRSADTGRVVELHAEGGQQQIRIDGVGGWSLVWTTEEVCRAPRFLFGAFSLKLDGDRSHPDCITLEYYGSTDRLFPLRQESAPGSSLKRGDYVADSIGVRMAISDDIGKPRADMVGRFGSKTYLLEPGGTHLWRLRSADATPWGGILSLGSDHAVATIRTPQNWQITFRRLP